MKEIHKLPGLAGLTGCAARVVIGAPESDPHVVALKLLEVELTGQGFEVHNLGVCTAAEEFADAAAQLQPMAIAISSLNGNALTDLQDLKARLEEAGLGQIPVFLGGNLTVGSQKDPAAIQAAFTSIGITVLETFEEAVAQLHEMANSAPSQQLVRAWG